MIAVRRAAAPAPPPVWMTAQEVAAELGCHVETVYAMAKIGTLPGARRHGVRSWRFHREELEAYKHGRALAPVRPVESERSHHPPTEIHADAAPACAAVALPLVPAAVTAGDLERLGLLLLGYAELLRRQPRRPEKEGR